MRAVASPSATFPKRRRLRRLEDPVQRSILAWLRTVLPTGSLVFHCPNAAKRSKAEGGRFKSLGVVAGIPDLIAIVPGPMLLGAGRFPILIAGEVKAGKGKTTDAQDAIGSQWRTLGGHWGVWRSIEDARQTLAEAGVITRETGVADGRAVVRGSKRELPTRRSTISRI